VSPLRSEMTVRQKWPRKARRCNQQTHQTRLEYLHVWCNTMANNARERSACACVKEGQGATAGWGLFKRGAHQPPSSQRATKKVV
jgi:hypothetical protein